MDFAQLPFLFSLNNIDISDSRILFEDMLSNKTHSVEQLHLAIPSFSNFSFQSTNYIQPYFSAIINGSPIQLSGEAVQVAKDQGFQTRLSCTIESLDLVPYFSYLPSSFPLTLFRGRADTSLQIDFSPKKKQGSRLSIDIKMTASDIKVQSKNEGLTLESPAVKVEGSLEPFAKRLHIKSLVMKAPQLSSRKGQLAANIQELLPHSSPTGKAQHQFAIDLALADQGRLVLINDKKTAAKDLTWNALQLSIKNFKTAGWNKQQQDTVGGTFRLSGEMEKEKGSFSWQGKITEFGKVQGKLLLNEFPAAPLLTLLGPPSGEKIEGSATFAGPLTLFSQQKRPADYNLTNGTLQLHHLKLFQGKERWLEAGAVRFTRLGRTDGRFHLGNILLKNATLNLNTRNLPPLLKRFSKKENALQLEAIDFSGILNIKTKTGTAPGLQLSNCRLQVSNLDKLSSKDKPSAKENLAFSAHLLPDGLIKGKGGLSLAPFQVQANLDFSNVDNSLLSPFFIDWPLLHNSKATLHGKGLYHFPQALFQGSLRLTDTTVQRSPKTSLLSWHLAEFSKLDCRFSPFQLKAEALLLDNPQIQWQRKENDANPFQQVQRGIKTLLQNKQGSKKKGEQKEFFPMSVKEITFQNGTLTYLDQRLPTPWQATVEKLAGSLKNFDTAGTAISPFTLSGTLEKVPLSLSGSLTLFSDPPRGRAKLQLTDFPLASLQRQLASQSINTDSASLNLHLAIAKEASLFSSKAEMLISDLAPSTATSDTALPLALLKDAKGSFPLTVHMKEGSNSLIQESMNSFQTTVIKASYAPLLLDPEFADLQENNFVTFQPGSSKILPAAQETLIRYTELLGQHPSLALSVSGLADRENDQRALQKRLEEKEQQRVDEENAKGEDEYRKKQEEFVPLSPRNSLQEQDMSSEDLAGYIPILPNPVHVSNEELLGLARERTLLVYDFYTQSLGIPIKRILQEKEGKIIDTDPGNRVIFTLKPMPLADSTL